MKLTRTIMTLDCGEPDPAAVLAFARAAAHYLDAKAHYDVLDKRATAAFNHHLDSEGVALTEEASALASQFGALEAAVQHTADCIAFNHDTQGAAP